MDVILSHPHQFFQILIFSMDFFTITKLNINNNNNKKTDFKSDLASLDK